jgi:uncharacterized membrane protein
MRLWDRVRSSYWFVPAGLTLAAAAAAVVITTFERSALGQQVVTALPLRTVSPDGARAILSTLAGSMVTLAGVTFSITIVALTVASSQFGPRLLANFMRDTGNQVSLGTFIATFTFSLLVLRRVGGVESSDFVPQLALTVAMALGIVSLGVLIYFIDHVSRSIQARQVISVAGRQLDHALETFFPEGEEAPEEDEAIVQQLVDRTSAGTAVTAEQSGYVEIIDHEGLLEDATELNLLIEECCRNGEFIVEGEPLLRVLPAPSAETVKRLRERVALTVRRPDRGDVLTSIRQVVEIGVRALSPGVNDPFTAANCIEQLGASLRLLAERGPSIRLRRDDGGAPRLILPSSPIEEVVDAAFDPMRLYGRGTLIVPLTLLHTLSALGAQARQPDLRAALRVQLERVHDASLEALSLEADQQRLERAYRVARKVLKVE